MLISVGGISTPEDAWERILAGATLLQAYTGFVYGGPAWPAHVNRALAQLVRAAGADSIQQLVGGLEQTPLSGRVGAPVVPAGLCSRTLQRSAVGAVGVAQRRTQNPCKHRLPPSTSLHIPQPQVELS